MADNRYIEFVSDALDEFPTDKKKVNEWFQELEAAANGLGLKAEDKRAVLTAKMGGRRIIRVSQEATRRGEMPQEENQRDFNWLKAQTIKTFGEERSLYRMIKELVNRRLSREETVSEYRTDREARCNEIWEAFTTEYENIEPIKAAFFNDAILDGLPESYKTEVKKSLPQQIDRSTIKIESIAESIREASTPKKKFPQRKRYEVDEEKREKKITNSPRSQSRFSRSAEGEATTHSPRSPYKSHLRSQDERRCSKCGRAGHSAHRCKSTPRREEKKPTLQERKKGFHILCGQAK